MSKRRPNLAARDATAAKKLRRGETDDSFLYSVEYTFPKATAPVEKEPAKGRRVAARSAKRRAA